ncbi:MAG: hypothetical protein CVV47_00540 [Spirochaetae bacterium HGW-Spirochaetae-3]|jgi:hypothetical protein|nr:MAG: hypothetical protein CVV47_00540 [Spirochaetae bacterium HGW-Spirochaetae-3]
MLKFFLKKSFYDGWDNMLALAGFNGAFLAIVGVGVWLPSLSGSPALAVAGLAIAAAAGSVWWSVAAHALWRVAEFKTVRLDDVKAAFAAGWAPGLQLGAVVAATVLLASVAFPFYASIGGFLGLFASSLAFWLFVGIWLTLQYFLPLKAARGGDFSDTLKTSFLLFMDAPFFALASAIDGALCVALSPIVAFLLPGPSAAVLVSCEATRLRLHRMRWVAGRTGEGKPGRTPWPELLADDREALGERGLGDLLFPWKR